jgi:hypothetical protein
MMNEDTPLGEAWKHIRENAKDGLKCPACEQHVQIYWRPINSGMAASAVRMLRKHLVNPGGWIHNPSEIGRRSAEESKLAWWGLIEEEKILRPDGGRAGYWRLTDKGVSWAQGRTSVPRYAIVFDGKLLLGSPLWPGDNPTPYSKTGHRKPDTTVYSALGDHFNYRELLEGEA